MKYLKFKTKPSEHEHLGLLYNLFPIIKVFLLLILCFFFGFLYGIGLFLSLRYFYIIYMKIIYNLNPLGRGDYAFIYNHRDESYMICLLLKFDSLDKNAFLSNFIEKGVKTIERLRSIRTTKNYEFWLKVLPVEDAIDMIKIDEIEFDYENMSDNNDEEKRKTMLDERITIEINKKINVDNELPYRLIFVKEINIKNEKKTEVYKHVMFLFDHSFSDGMGIVSLVISLADNYSQKLFPYGKNFEIGILYKIFSVILFPYYFLKILYRYIFQYRNGNMIKLDYNHDRSEKSKLGSITNISSEGLLRKCKKLNITFNDIYLNMSVVSLKKAIFKKFQKVITVFTVIVTVGLKIFPNNIKDIKVDNSSIGIILQFSTIKDSLFDNIKTIKNETSAYLKDIFYVLNNIYLNWGLSSLLPHTLLNYIFVKESRSVEFITSNVPLPKEPLYYNSFKCIEMLPYITSGFGNIFMVCVSYNQKFSFLFSFNESVPLDPSDVIEEFKKELLVMNKEL